MLLIERAICILMQEKSNSAVSRISDMLKGQIDGKVIERIIRNNTDINNLHNEVLNYLLKANGDRLVEENIHSPYSSIMSQTSLASCVEARREEQKMNQIRMYGYTF